MARQQLVRFVEVGLLLDVLDLGALGAEEGLEGFVCGRAVNKRGRKRVAWLT
jgi:hypothetical protein